MALQKSLTLPNGSFGAYIRLGHYRRNRARREAVAHFDLFADKASADANPQLPVAMIACLRLKDARFDEFLSNAAIAAASNNVEAQLYRALKAAANGHNPHEIDPGGGLSQLNLTDATDV